MNKQEVSKEELIIRDKLAISRTKLANQRTLLSYIRTGLYFIVTAVGIFYLEKKEVFGGVEYILSGLGVIIIIIGIVVYLRLRKKINCCYTS